MYGSGIFLTATFVSDEFLFEYKILMRPSEKLAGLQNIMD